MIALRHIDLNAVDAGVAVPDTDIGAYLVKPVSFDRFLTAIQQARRFLQQDKPEAKVQKEVRPDMMFVKAEGKLVKVNLQELWLVEGLEDYVRLWIGTTRIVVYSTMKHMADMLSDKGYFIRVSKSYIVNMNYVNELDGNSSAWAIRPSVSVRRTGTRPWRYLTGLNCCEEPGQAAPHRPVVPPGRDAASRKSSRLNRFAF